MVVIAHSTVDFQRLARAAQRARWAQCVLALGRAALVAMLAVVAARAALHGWVHLSAALAAATLLAAGLAWAARPGELCRLAWVLLGPHLARLRRRAEAARAACAARALARGHGADTASATIIVAILKQLALPIVNNRHLAHLAISQKLISQRPN